MDAAAVVGADTPEGVVPKLVEVPNLGWGTGVVPKMDGFAAALLSLVSGEVCIVKS